jgi:tetratricopeptide (TPR) repeat protein
MVDDVRRWSDELAQDPTSMVFLPLAEALRRQGQLELALKIALRGLERHPRHAEAHDLLARIAVDRGDLDRAFTEWDAVLRTEPGHLGAMKGLGYVCFQQGRFADAERFLSQAAAGGGGVDVTAALANVRRSAGVSAAEIAVADPQRLFADLLVDDGQTGLLLDAQGYVLGGIYVDPDGRDVAQDVGAQLSGITEEVERATRHLGIGQWKTIVFETQVAVVAMSPAPEESLLMIAVSRATPIGLVRRLLDRCAERARWWLGGEGERRAATGEEAL